MNYSLQLLGREAKRARAYRLYRVACLWGLGVARQELEWQTPWGVLWFGVADQSLHVQMLNGLMETTIDLRDLEHWARLTAA